MEPSEISAAMVSKETEGFLRPSIMKVELKAKIEGSTKKMKKTKFLMFLSILVQEIQVKINYIN